MIARKLEESGISTVVLGSCRDMMVSVLPPRSVFVDFPLGHPCGKPGDIQLQRSIVKDALDHLVSAGNPGEMKDLPYQWGESFSWADFMKDVEEMINAEEQPIQDWKPGD